MAITCSVTWNYTQYNTVTERSYTGNQNIGLNSDGLNPISNPSYNNTDLVFTTRSLELYNALPAGYGATFYVTGCLAGGGIIPPNTPAHTLISGNIMNVPGQAQDLWNRVIRVFQSGDPDEPVDVSANGKYYKDSSGNWHDMETEILIATAQEVANLPQDVEFNGWLVEHEIIEGDDGNYYDLAGNELFQNLPSGVIPVHQIITPSSDAAGNLSDGVFEGTDGNYYNVEGNQVLENLPQGVTPVSQIGDIVVGSDGGYYDLHGDGVMENLPSGVTITGYDSQNDTYQGSDGNDYDIHGDEVEPSSECDGELLQYGNTFRLTFKGVDVFGNDFTFYKDVSPADNTIILDSNTVSTIRKIDRITIRNLNSGYSTGNSRLKISSRVVGFRVGIDIDALDPDFVMGNFTVCDCLFHTCDKYADVVLNSDLPLGFVPNTSSLDVGIYCLIDALWLDWSLDNTTQFPYCCGSYVETEKGSGSTSDNNDSSNSDIVEAIEKLTEAVKELSCLVEVVVSPAEDVNIYNRRFHYNDENGVSGFSS